ncbi:MarR family winged helix-turn-helix transcriptional regulator [Halobacillus seohaensis]|uniref:MarR family winged helix-turn-helix transcriptional regulator n=1 Tax=Halobacillus seohaensis TaxID=447421 RepID=A0ABW2EMK4_9BACI
MNIKLKQNSLLMIRALYFSMEEQWSNLGRIHDITPAQQHILFLLMTNQKTLTPSEISEFGCWHPSTVTRLLKPMQNKGYITISPDEERPKFKKVRVTIMREDMFQKLVVSVEKTEDFPLDMSNLKEEEILQFIEYGERILGNHKGDLFMEKVIHGKFNRT